MLIRILSLAFAFITLSAFGANAGAQTPPPSLEQVGAALESVLGEVACSETGIGSLLTGRTDFLASANALIQTASTATGRNNAPARAAAGIILANGSVDQTLLNYRGSTLVNLAISDCVDLLSVDTIDDLAAEAWRIVVTEGGLATDLGEYTKAIFILQSRYLHETEGFPETEYARLVTAYDQASGLATPYKMRVLHYALEKLLIQKLPTNVPTEHERLRVLEFVTNILTALSEREDQDEPGLATAIAGWTEFQTDLEGLGHNLSTVNAFRRGYYKTHTPNAGDASRAVGLIAQVDDIHSAYRTERTLGAVKQNQDGSPCREGLHRLLSAVGAISIATVEHRPLQTLEAVRQTWTSSRDESLGWYSDSDQRVVAPYYRYGAAIAEDVFYLPEGMRRAESFTETVEFLEQLREIGLTSQGSSVDDVYGIIGDDVYWPPMSKVGLDAMIYINNRFADRLGQIDEAVYTRWATVETSFLSSDQSSLGTSMDAGLLAGAVASVSSALSQAGHGGLATWFTSTVDSNPSSTRQDFPSETSGSFTRLHNFTVSCVRSRVGELKHEEVTGANNNDCALAQELLPGLQEHLNFILAWQPNANEQVGVWQMEEDAMSTLMALDVAAKDLELRESIASQASDLRQKCRRSYSLLSVVFMTHWGDCAELHPDDPALVVISANQLIEHLDLPRSISGTGTDGSI